MHRWSVNTAKHAPVVDIYIASLNRCAYITSVMREYYGVHVCPSHCLTPEKFPGSRSGNKYPMLRHVDQIYNQGGSGEKYTHLILVDDNFNNIADAASRGYLVQCVDGCGMTDDTLRQLRSTIRRLPPGDQVVLLVDFDCTLTQMRLRGDATKEEHSVSYSVVQDLVRMVQSDAAEPTPSCRGGR